MVLSIEVLDRGTLDINCTPDKRTVFVEHLSDMCDQIRTILNKLFEASSNVYVVSNKRTQETTESDNPPTKQMRIERFAKPVRSIQLFSSNSSLLYIDTIDGYTCFGHGNSTNEIFSYTCFEYNKSINEICGTF